MMGRASSSNEVRTLVLVGRTGNGKSATGNSILGRKAFKPRAGSSNGTSTCELQRTIQRDGQTINVIDTPGLFSGLKFVGKEIVKCIDMAKDGIHAILLVLSVRTRFSHEEEAVMCSLQNLFGNKIVDYMIVVFTGGDELEENDQTLEGYLGHECPEPLKEILAQCGNRCVLFDNKTTEKSKQFGQVQHLLSLVNLIISQNGGRPYTDELFKALEEGATKLCDQQSEVESLKGYSKVEILELKEQMQQKYDDELKRTTEMVESKLKEGTTDLLQQLVQVQATRLKVLEDAKSTQVRADNEIQKLRRDLEEANRKINEKGYVRCAIL